MKLLSRIIVAGVIVSSLVGASVALAVGISGTDKYAWGENIGWLNWGTPEGHVDVGLQEMSGYVWGENIGWISLNCNDSGTCATVSYHVNYSAGVVSGYAWGENVGWISFNCSNTSSCGTVDYGVTITPATGVFSGYAWGENVGWISFNCSNTNSCGTVDYKVSTAAPIQQGGSGGGGGGPGGGGPGPTGTPSPTSTPGVTPSPSSTPTPTPGPTPSSTPGPTPPVFTPISTPPPSTPGVPPPSSTPGAGPGNGGGGIVGGINAISQFFDYLIHALFGQQLPPPVTAGAAAVAVAAIVPLAVALAVALAQNEIGALTYHTFVVFGLRRKAKVWGTVYDSQTKRPVPLAKLQLVDETGHVLETRFADRDGRYGFLTNAQSLHANVLKLRIVASKAGYVFPSHKVALGVDFLVYDHTYFGQVLELRPDTFLSFNVPMDPVAGTRRLSSALGLSLIGTLTDKLLNLGFIIGLFVVPLNYIWYPTTTNLVILIAFVAANAVRLLVVYRPYGVVRDAVTKKPLPFALVTLNDLDGKRVAFAVSDERGRYFLPAERGKEYILSIFTPANVTVARTTSIRITPHSRTSRHAWVTLNTTV